MENPKVSADIYPISANTFFGLSAFTPIHKWIKVLPEVTMIKNLLFSKPIYSSI